MSRLLAAIRRWAPTLTAGPVVLVVLLTGHTPPVAVLAYSAYLAGAVLLPGVLLLRGLLRRPDHLLAELAWGGVVGMVWELVGWAIFTGAGFGHALVAWPVLTVVVFAATPRLRGCFVPVAGSVRTPRLLAWAVSASMSAAVVLQGVGWFRQNPVPGSGSGLYYVDVPWHLGVAYELQRTTAPVIPEAAAEGHLHYHWFVNAHDAASGLITHIDLATIVTRLWLPWLTFVVLATASCLALQVSRSTRTAALTAALVAAPTAGFSFVSGVVDLSAVNADSPSLLYGIGITCLLGSMLVDSLRGAPWRPGAVVLLGVAAVAATGSKPSILPELLAGLGLAVVVRWRRREPVWPLALPVGMFVAAIGLSIPLFASASGSTIGPFALVQGGSVPPWEQTTAFLLAAYVPIAGVLACAAIPLIRREPATPLLLGGAVAGFLAAWVVDHPGQSQLHFWANALPFASLLLSWTTVTLLQGQGRKVARLGGILLVALMVLGAVPYAALRPGRGTAGLLAILLLVWVAVAAGRVLGLRVARSLLVLACCGIVASLPAQVVLDAATADPRPDRTNRERVEAARWILTHVPGNALLATNSFCLAAPEPGQPCDARSFWLSGFSGHRVLLSGYGVTPAQLARRTASARAWQVPYHDADLENLNRDAVVAPTPGVLAALEDHGVSWLVVDRSEDHPSPRLDALASRRYDNATVIVYRLPPLADVAAAERGPAG